MSDVAYVNTDRELWREREGDFYAHSIHVTDRGSIGINCGGSVIVMPLERWHAAALAECEAVGRAQIDELVRGLEGWKEPEQMSDDRARQFWLMKQAAKMLRRLSVMPPTDEHAARRAEIAAHFPPPAPEVK